MKTANKIDDPVLVEKEFNDWAEAWDIDNDMANMDEEEKDDFNAQKSKITRAMKKGRLVFNRENESLEYTLTYTRESNEGRDTVVVLSPPKGAAYMAMDDHKSGKDVHKMYAMLGALCKKSTRFFAVMDGRDLKLIQAVVVLFLAS